MNAGRLLELIYTPLGFGIKNGQRVPMSFFGPAVMADHFDHVHVAMATGGVVQQSGWAVVGERGPELAHFPGGSTVYDAGQTRRVHRGGPVYSGPTMSQIATAHSEPPIVHVTVNGNITGEDDIKDLIHVEIEQAGRRSHAQWTAGVRAMTIADRETHTRRGGEGPPNEPQDHWGLPSRAPRSGPWGRVRRPPGPWGGCEPL